jgi:hypothetical protein
MNAMTRDGSTEVLRFGYGRTQHRWGVHRKRRLINMEGVE